MHFKNKYLIIFYKWNYCPGGVECIGSCGAEEK